ncbi:putative inorganic phosphate cotransporter [Macrobrachium nipponense]|uniref:putative inorganic phosphate cotransporter n=1 Tax=Macrobrachium nipponense TaxID=159736 RepID=UPI0030C7BE69
MSDRSSQHSTTSHEQLSQDVVRRLGEEDPLTDTAPLYSQERGGCLGKRHLLAFMGFLGFANVYAMRVNLSVAIVAMVNNTAIPHANKSISEECEFPGDNSTLPSKDGEFVWDESEQGLILGSFFYGYVLTNFLGGRLGELIGGKIVFAVGVLVTSILTLLTPVVAYTNITPLIVTLRILEGLGEGVTFPAMNSLMARWIPPLERSKMSAYVYAGAQFGTVVSLPICGLLCQSDFLGGWPSVFYVFGVLGLLWFIFWMLLISNTPESHPTISLEEKIYIQTTLNDALKAKTPKIPWKHILTSMPFWAIFVVHIAQNWGFYFLLTELPTYMKNILHFSLANQGFMSALPYFVGWIFSICAGLIADKLRTTGVLSTTATRRIFNSIGFYGPMVCLVLVGYAGCNKNAAIALLCGAVGLNGAVYSGYMNSHLDIAPNFAGTLMGITNTAATVPGFLAPQIVGILITGKQTVSRWQLVFWIAAIVYFVGNTFYVIFISGEQQPWNDLPANQGSTSVKEREEQVGQYGSIPGQNQNQLAASDSIEAQRDHSHIPEVF